MTKGLAAAAVLALLAGCAGVRESPDARRTMGAVQDCHYARAPTLDDGQSDAATIGRAVHRSCLLEANAALRASLNPYASAAYRESYEAEFMHNSQDHATRAVLEARLARKSK